MNHKKIISCLLGLSVIGVIAGFVFTDLHSFDLCREKYIYQYGEENNINNPPTTGCLDPISENIGQPIGIGSMALGIVFIILIFLPKPYFTAWRKFAIWFVPLAALWIITSPAQGGSGLGLGMSFDKELAVFWSSGLYITISLLIIIVKAIRSRLMKSSSNTSSIV